MLERVFQNTGEFDIIHFHIDYFHFPLSRRHAVPNITTLHGRLDIPDLVPIYGEFPEMPVVSISDAQRGPLPMANWQGTIYHGLPLDLYTFREKPGDYLVFVGRISPEKRVDRAIEIAKRTGMKLVVAAKVDKVDEQYYEAEIEPLLDHPLVEYIGEVNEREKDELLGNAYAFIFPIDWPEPFGLAMIEAMACGTPVITVPLGSTAEIIEQGVNGFICETMDDIAQAVVDVSRIDRRLCRRSFEERFSAPRMARDYVELYRRLLAARDPASELRHASYA
jgi:glycosyltransferase involved in cell wall biosynthesis